MKEKTAKNPAGAGACTPKTRFPLQVMLDKDTITRLKQQCLEEETSYGRLIEEALKIKWPRLYLKDLN